MKYRLAFLLANKNVSHSVTQQQLQQQQVGLDINEPGSKWVFLSFYVRIYLYRMIINGVQNVFDHIKQFSLWCGFSTISSWNCSFNPELSEADPFPTSMLDSLSQPDPFRVSELDFPFRDNKLASRFDFPWRDAHLGTSWQPCCSSFDEPSTWSPWLRSGQTVNIKQNFDIQAKCEYSEFIENKKVWLKQSCGFEMRWKA